MTSFLFWFIVAMGVQYVAVGGLLIWNGNVYLGMTYLFYAGANVFLALMV